MIGKTCKLNDAALKFSRDCYIINKKTHTPVLKSKRAGIITGKTKSGNFYILWEGNSKPVTERADFVTILLDKIENISQQGDQC